MLCVQPLNSAVSNPSIQKLMLVRPTQLYGETMEILETAVKAIGKLKKIDLLRLCILSERLITRIQNQLELISFEQNLQRCVVTECLTPLSNRLKNLDLEGGWVSDGLVIEMPHMEFCETLRLVPAR